MTPAEMLKSQMKKTWKSFSDEELYRVLCLLVDQIETLEKQNKSLKKDLNNRLEHKSDLEIKQIELLKSHVKKDAIKIIEETEKLSKDILIYTTQTVERVKQETLLLEQQQLKLKAEMMDFIDSKLGEV